MTNSKASTDFYLVFSRPLHSGLPLGTNPLEQRGVAGVQVRKSNRLKNNSGCTITSASIFIELPNE